MFTKELNSDYGGFNSAYPEDLRLAPYTEKLVAPSEVATVDDSDDWVL